MGAHSYEVRVDGDLEALVDLEEFGAVESVEHTVTTVLSGSFEDMEALSRVLRRLRAYGLEVVEIRRVLGRDGPGTETDHARSEERHGVGGPR